AAAAPIPNLALRDGNRGGVPDTPDLGGGSAATDDEQHPTSTAAEETSENRCPRSSSWSARAARTRSARPRLLPSREARSAAACAPASTPPPRRSRTRRCAR